MLPIGRFGRRDRLLRNRDIRAVLRRGRRRHGQHLQVVAWWPRSSGSPGTAEPMPCDWPQLGMSVAKAVGSSPARARMRRLLREAFRALRNHCRRPLALMIVARTPWPDATLAWVTTEIFDLVAQLGASSTRAAPP